jgi:WD40 repeat protein
MSGQRASLLLTCLALLPYGPAAAQPPAAGPNVPDKPAPARTDRYGQALPEGVLARLGARKGERGLFTPLLVLSADGTVLAESGVDPTVRLWDVGSGRELRQLPGHPDGVKALALSPDGKAVAVVGSFAPPVVWDAATGKEVCRCAGGRNEQQWNLLAFSPDGKSLVAASWHQEGPLPLWDARTGKLVRRFARSGRRLGGVSHLAFSAAGDTLACAGRRVWCWETATGKELALSPESERRVACFGLSARGALLTVESAGDALLLREAATGKEAGRLRRAAYAHGALVCPDGQALVWGEEKRDLLLWDGATGKVLVRSKAEGGLPHGPNVALSRDGKVLVLRAPDYGLRVWDVAAGKERRQFGGPQEVFGGTVGFAPGGDVLAVSAGAARWWDRATGNERRQLALPRPQWMSPTALSADARLLALVADKRQEGQVRVWDLAAGKEIHRCGAKDASPGALAFSPDGRTLAVTDGEAVRLWSLTAGREGPRFEVGTLGTYPARVAFSPDGKALATMKFPGQVRLWEAGTGKERRVLEEKREEGGPGAVDLDKMHRPCVAFSPDGTLVAGAGQDQRVVLWGAATGRQLRRCEPSPGVEALAFTPDGHSLLSGGHDGLVCLWEVATGKLRRHWPTVAVLSGHAATLAPDGRSLVVLASEGVEVWDLTALGPGAPPARLAAGEADALWRDLGSDDAALAHRAVWRLASAPASALPLLRGRLRPAAAAESKQVARWIADLDHAEFPVRERASAELGRAGGSAEPALRQALASAETRASVERRRRLERALREVRWAARAELRAVEVLDLIGAPETRPLLEALAKGAPEAALTREAKRSLLRPAGRSAPRP